MRKFLVTLSVLSFLLFGCVSSHPALETVASVDIDKYAGLWHEIASFPQKFQEGCHCTTANYTKSEEGFLIVENRCNKDSITGAESYIKGKAFMQEGSNNAKLSVQFFWPFKGDYWIIDLDSNYSYAVVGHPNRNYLWILSRTPQMDETQYTEIIKRAADKGFDITRLNKTIQCK